jgi:hypothetical protein
VSWFLKAVERDDGRWECRLGREVLGVRPTLVSALYVLVETAIALGGREMFTFHLHHRDGVVEHRPATDVVPGEED